MLLLLIKTIKMKEKGDFWWFLWVPKYPVINQPGFHALRKNKIFSPENFAA